MRVFARFAAVVCHVLVLAAQAVAAPAVSNVTPTPGETVQSLTSITVSFSETVSGVDADDLTVNGETAASVSGFGTGPYVFTFTQPPPGEVVVSWEFDHGITGLGTGAFVPGPSWTYTLVDTVAPTVAKIRTSVAGQEQDAIAPLPGSVVASLTRVAITFSEEVVGLDAGDLLINGTPASSVELGSGAGPHVFTFPQPAAGTVTFSWAPGHGITDTAAAANAFTGQNWTVTLDPAAGRNLQITEFLAANATSIVDENGDSSGWIEIFNPGPTAVNLAGWTLSNDSNDLRMWVFPARSLAANSRLYLFASGKDRKPTSGNLHTNFELSKGEGFLALSAPESSIPVFSYNPYPVQRYDYSYGIQSGGGFRYFARIGTGTDTRPGSANPTSTLTTVTPAPVASVSRGIFNQPFAVTLSCADSSATIRYTLDGSEPLASSTAYSQPLAVTGTTILRMAAFGANSVPSESITHSYIVTEQVIGQPSPPYDNPALSTDNTNPPLPTIGGVQFPISWGTLSGQGFPGQITNLPADAIPADYGMDPEVYQSPIKYNDNGVIDSAGGKTNLERIRQSFRELPILSIVLKMDDFFGPNGIYPKSTQKNPPIEKACSVELLPTDGSTGFMVTCAIRPHGNSSRNPSNSPKHPFKLKFKGEYGAANLEFPLFPDTAAQKFDDVVLRADYNTSWLHWDPTVQRPKGTRQRDAWSKHTFRDMGREAGYHRYVHLFINGLYWGVYDATEQENENFARNYYGGKKEDYEVVEQHSVKSGSGATYNAMVALVNAANFTQNQAYEQMKRYLDIPQFIDYMLLHFFIGHEDWAVDITKNWYAIRNAKNNGTFKYLPWDQENILYEPNVDRTGVATPPSGIQPKLVNNPQYRLDFADRVNRHMLAPDGALTPAANIARWNYWKNLLMNSLVAESARWGDYRRDVHVRGSAPLYTWNQHAIAEHNRLTSVYFPQRTTNVMSQLRARGLYPTLNAPEIRANSDSELLGRKRVAAGFQVKMQLPAAPLPHLSTNGNAGATQIYYTTDGTDPRVYYAGTIASTAQVYSTPLTINSTTTIKARTFDSAGNTWSALNEVTLTVNAPLLPKIRITELMYNPIGGTAYEYIEFLNAGPESVNMSGWYMEGVEFIFPADTIVAPGSRVVIASNDNPVAWAARYPGVQVMGEYGGSLNNAGERITLRDRQGRIIVSVDYDDGAPWPIAADGNGYSLEIVDLDGDPDSPFNWRASAAINGTPGSPGSTGQFGTSVQISEVLVINNGAVTNGGHASPFIELRNTGDSPADVSGWMLQGSNGLYIIPGGTIIPVDGFLVIWIDNEFEAPGLHATDFTLPPGGGGIRLYAAGQNSHARDQVTYGAQVGNRSIGRLGDGWALNTPTPGAANVAAATAPLTAVALNEWLANQSVEDQGDWVEMYNRDATLPVALQGLYLQAGSKIAQMQNLSFIEPNGFVRLFLGEQAEQLDLTLPASGTALSLFSPNGDLLESVTVSAASAGETEGRFPDGTSAFFKFGLNATPGAPNVLINNYTGPRLNELLVVNSTRETAPWGARVPWLELHNPSGTNVDLSGYGLASRRHAPANEIYRLPQGTVIPANGYQVIWLGLPPGGVVPAGTLATAMTLYQGGGAIYLLNASNHVVDSIEWGSQVEDLSIGRVSDQWRLLSATSPGASNSTPATLGNVSSLKLNEWLAAPASGSDFIELFNTGTAPVELTGLYLTDDPSVSGLSKYQIPPLSFIGGRGWARFIATSNPPSGVDAEVSFALSAEGESIRLSGPDLSLIDAVSFGLQTTGRSEGRILDGETIFGGLIPTPGGRNILPPAPLVTDHPEDTTVDAGMPVTFSVTATGSAPLSYQWYFRGTPIPGATASTLQISPATVAHDGVYYCVVSNTAGSETSNPATLRVNGTFEQWRAFYFNGSELGNEAISGSSADPDGDGLSNLQEFFHGLDPRAPLVGQERSALPEIGVEPATGTPQYLTLTFRRATRAAGVTAELQASATLQAGSWNTITPSAVEELGPDPLTGDPRVRWKVSISPGEAAKFLRLHLSLPGGGGN